MAFSKTGTSPAKLVKIKNSSKLFILGEKRGEKFVLYDPDTLSEAGEFLPSEIEE